MSNVGDQEEIAPLVLSEEQVTAEVKPEQEDSVGETSLSVKCRKHEEEHIGLTETYNQVISTGNKKTDASSSPSAAPSSFTKPDPAVVENSCLTEFSQSPELPPSVVSRLPVTSAKQILEVMSGNEAREDKEEREEQEENSSSIGSSLVEESVSSWLATTSDSLLTGEESARQETPGPSLTQENSVSDCEVHYLSDGHYWEDTAPLSPLDSQQLLHYKPPSHVSFSAAPIRQFSTHSTEDYDRRNESVNPAAASAEYELEKRLDMMEIFSVELDKSEAGLGLSVLGMGTGAHLGQEKLGIYVKSVAVGGVAELDGRIRVNDQIVEVNGVSLVGVTQVFAASILQSVTGRVSFLLGREERPEDSEVARLVRNQVRQGTEQGPLRGPPSRVSFSPKSPLFVRNQVRQGTEQGPLRGPF